LEFLNQAAFDDPASFELATGQDLDSKTAFVDGRGNILFRAQTGGIISPMRTEIAEGETLHRFADGKRDAPSAMAGGWWVQRPEFDRILRFARINDLTDPMAARILLGVPPEWQDMGIMVRARVRRPILAWRGLANSVITPHRDGGPKVSLLHQNANAERRLSQLFIPGMSAHGGRSLASEAFSFEGEWRFSKAEAMRGWIYV
jgi:hypothetical protein